MNILYQAVLIAFAINLVRSSLLLWRMWGRQMADNLGAETAIMVLIASTTAFYLPLQFQWVFAARDAALPDWETIGWVCFDLYLCGVFWAVETYIGKKVQEADQ